MRDYADKSWIKRRFREGLFDPDPGMPLPELPDPAAVTAVYQDKLHRSLGLLGQRWRGRSDCTHVYVNSDGETTAP